MKNIFIFSLLISLAMICSCQKQDSAAEQQLAQRKVELDAREDALIEREKVADQREKTLAEREKALAEKEKATANVQMTPTGVQDQIPDPAQMKAERDKMMQQVRAEMLSLIPDNSKMKAERDRRIQEQLAQRPGGPEKLQSEMQRKFEMSGAAVSPAVEAASATPSPTPQ